MKRSEWAFIVNPVAGNGYARKLGGEIAAIAGRHGVQAAVFWTRGKGNATELARKCAARGFTHIIAVGGDGTFGEVAAGIIGRKGVVFGTVAAGTGNDFIPITGFPERFTESAWDAFFRGVTARMDVGRCNERIFINGMGLGFDAQVAAENYKGGAAVKKGSKVKYIWHIVKTILFYKEKNMRITLGKKTSETSCFMSTVANGRRFAGGFYLTPKAYADDGLLDICFISKLGVLGRFRVLVSVIRGRHLKEKVVKYYQTPRLLVEFETEMPGHTDGELFFSKRFDVHILPGALNIICDPAGSYFKKAKKPAVARSRSAKRRT